MQVSPTPLPANPDHTPSPVSIHIPYHTVYHIPAMAHLFGFLNSEMEQPQTTSRIHAPPIWSTKNVVGWLVLKRKQIVVWITTKVHSKLREVPIPTSDRSVHICGHLEKYLDFITLWEIL